MPRMVDHESEETGGHGSGSQTTPGCGGPRRQSLALQDAELIERVFESYEYVAGLIQEKNMSIGRLQKMLFGAKTEKTRQVVGNSDQADAEPNSG